MIVITDDKHYTDIAAAIREKNGETTTYKPSEMAAAILEITTGKNIKTMTIDETAGTFKVTYDDGTTANGSVTFDENGNPTALSDDAGNSVTFTDGLPTSAKDSDDNTVTITWEASA